MSVADAGDRGTPVYRRGGAVCVGHWRFAIPNRSNVYCFHRRLGFGRPVLVSVKIVRDLAGAVLAFEVWNGGDLVGLPGFTPA